MTTLTAKDAFQDAKNLRRKYPLTSGADKLRETRSSLSRMQETIYQIGEYLKNPSHFYKGQILGHCCTTDDKAVWIKSIPAQVAELLGYNILPSIAALINDRLSKRDTEATLDIANGMAKALLKDCERQEARLKGGISAEYDNMKTGYSEVHGLLVDADRIAEDALQVLDYTSKNSLAPVPKQKV
jgi:hypothetical protein|tara:strand:+ start:588 stop:1142 length:555 start_codon:yes stop_codon:yes gene_type:complete